MRQSTDGKEAIFWAEQIAEKIARREKGSFSHASAPKLKKWNVKSSSSLSGVLHIGRLSDIIRSEAVYKALKSRGFPTGFIYVTEDMDPLRKIPAGVPEKFRECIGMPVSDIPDPEGCHKSYAQHHAEIFFETMKQFLDSEPKRFSMREEYKKGNFNEEVMQVLKGTSTVREIINKFKEEGTHLGANWFPWQQVCEKCGKIQTTKITSVEDSKVNYVCGDYKFETETAKGCGHEGTADLKKANGKLVWKSEWAAQWKRWGVCSEGAGKEYESRNSAFWINAEICERVLNFPAPEPIFYEHLMVDGKKMSASLGNVIYPKDWLEVARPEALKYLFIKRITKARSFSWQDVPNLELELDRVIASVGANPESKKFFTYSRVHGRELGEALLDYSLATSLSQLFSSDAELIAKLQDSGSLPKKIPAQEKAALLGRLRNARAWSEKYAPADSKLAFAEKLPVDAKNAISPAAASLFPQVVELVRKSKSADALLAELFALAKSNNTQQSELFKSLYLALLAKERGPRIGTLIFALGQDRVIKRLNEFR
ncbi:MAG: lysine--tRNA ligase [Candidatus Diapherotrites archaeon]